MPILLKDRVSQLENQIKKLQEELQRATVDGGATNDTKHAIYMRRRAAT